MRAWAIAFVPSGGLSGSPRIGYNRDPLWLKLWSLFLLRRTPRALESGPSERQHLLGVGREESEWGRRTAKGVLPEDIGVAASLQPVFECLRLLLA